MNGKTATTSVQVVQIPIASISVTPTPTTLNVGGKKQLQAIVKDSAGNTLQNRTINWTSSDTLIADVSGTGTVTATGTGTATITATSEGKLAAATVNANPAVVASVSVSLNAGNIQIGQTTQAAATPRDSAGTAISGRSVTWTSSNPAVATVSSQGQVTAVANGSTSIKATVDGVNGTANLTVSTAVVASVGVTLGSSSLVAGATTQATATAADALGNTITGRAVTWTSSNTAVATVTNLGVVTAVGGGTASITATVDGVSGSATVVASAPTAATVTVTAPLVSLTAGQTTQATAIVRDAGGSQLNLAATWSSSAPSIATVSATGLITAVAAGSANITATAGGKTGSISVTVQSSNPQQGGSSSAVAATLPQVFLTTTVASTPSNGRTLRVASGGKLQAALDSAAPGDRILLAAGATFTGNFVIRPKAGSGPSAWITVTTDGSLPSEGSRVSPAQAGSYPKIVSPGLLPAIATEGAASFWRFTGVEITISPSITENQAIVQLGDASPAQNSLDKVPTDIVLDRVYVHGQTYVDARRCITFNTARTAIVDSYVSECHSAFDAQAVAGTNGPGPFKIVNNYLEAAAENIAFGGADPGIPNLVPSDIEIRHNYFSKAMAWRNSQWLVKNLLELKVGRRVLIDGNVMENSWPAAQAGFAFVLWSVNQNGTCNWCVTEHITIQNNIIRNVASGFQLTARWTGQPALIMNHVTIRNNVIIGLDNAAVAGGTSRLYQIGDAIQQLVIEHNPGFAPDATFLWGGDAPLTDHIVRNNLTGGGYYQIYTAYGQGSLAWTREAGPGSDFSGNVVALASDWLNVVPNNFYPQSMDAIGLAGGGGAALSAGATPDQLALSASSPYKGKATDGTDPGANISSVLSATANVVRSTRVTFAARP